MTSATKSYTNYIESIYPHWRVTCTCICSYKQETCLCTLWGAPRPADFHWRLLLWSGGWRKHCPSHNGCGPVQVVPSTRTLRSHFGGGDPSSVWGEIWSNLTVQWNLKACQIRTYRTCQCTGKYVHQYQSYIYSTFCVPIYMTLCINVLLLPQILCTCPTFTLNFVSIS